MDDPVGKVSLIDWMIFAGALDLCVLIEERLLAARQHGKGVLG